MVAQTISASKKRRLEKYGSWAVVTGASSGIGMEMARGVGAAGLNVVLVARSKGKLDNLAADLQVKYGAETKIIAADLGELAGVQAVEVGTADLDVGLLIASAGFGTSGSFLQSDIGDELNMLDVNCRALLILAHAFGQRFAARGRGGIVLMSSIVGFQGMPYAAHYAATKAYVQTLAEALRVELASSGVDVLASATGPTNSGFAERAGQKMGAALEAADVVWPTLNALGRRDTVLPGFLSKLLVYAVAPLPRPWRVRIMGQVMYGMTKHRMKGEGEAQVVG